MYLGRRLAALSSQDVELEYRLECGWRRLFAYKSKLCGTHYRLIDRLKLFGAVITPTVLYGSSTWTMTEARGAQLRTVPRRMLTWMLGSKLNKTNVGK